ncbi:MAG: hypothetical protein WCF24_10135, partial [Acidimicrobiales bacterium]
PVLIPTLASLAEIPAACAWRYDGTPSGLLAALTVATTTSPERRLAMSEAASSFASRLSWPVAARATYELFRDLAEAPPSVQNAAVIRRDTRIHRPPSNSARARR